MGKHSGDMGSDVFYAVFLERQKSAKKMLKQSLLFVSIVFTLIIGGISDSFAEITCGSPDSCVVIIDNYYYQGPFNYSTKICESTIDTIGQGCTNINNYNRCGTVTDPNIVTIPPNTLYYVHSIIKYYWDGLSWQPHSGGLYYSRSKDSNADYSSYWPWSGFIKPSFLYPNGCSDLPSQQPDQIPNIDTGSPGCNDQVL